MASILKFVARADYARRRTMVEGKVEKTCQIVIFPGVRYERWNADDKTSAPPTKRSRRRRARTS